MRTGMFSARLVDGGPVVIAYLAGELDSRSAYELVEALTPALTRGRSTIVLDLGALTFADSAGLSAVVTLARHANDAGIELAVRNCSPAATRLLSVTGLDTIVQLWPSS
jgi:anti-sigma B factor antagonist